jgi:hypothetical protein
LRVIIWSRLRIFLFTFAVAGVFAAQAADADWMLLRGLAKDGKVEVQAYGERGVFGRFVRVSDESITLSAQGAEKEFARKDVQRIKVPSPGRRMLYGVIGVAAGIAVGAVVCPGCINEGAQDIEGRNIAIGAGVGALAFLIPGSRTIYKGPKR